MSEFLRLAALALMAVYAVHAENMPDERFLDLLPLIERHREPARSEAVAPAPRASARRKLTRVSTASQWIVRTMGVSLVVALSYERALPLADSVGRC